MKEFGAPNVLVPADLPDPVAGPGQVLIDVATASITFVETQVRAGNPPSPAMAPQLPVIPGNGVGGVVSSVGAGIEATLLGKRVVTSTGGSGGYAELVAVDAAGLIGVPDSLGLAEAVALLADGRTAVALIRAAQVQAGETVLVEAAGGGVGSLLVQLARNLGACVVAAAGAQHKLELATELGANVTVNYADPGWADRIRAQLGGVDVVFDGVGGAIGRSAFELVGAGGRFCAFGMASGAFAGISDGDATRRNVAVTWGARIPPEDFLRLTQTALSEAAAGRLRPVIGQTFPLEQAAEAHAAIEARATLGKTLLVASPKAGASR